MITVSKRVLLALFLCMFVVDSMTLLACPNCKAGFEPNTTQAAIGEAYSMSIYMMLVVPASLATFVMFKIKRTMKKHQLETQESDRNKD